MSHRRAFFAVVCLILCAAATPSKDLSEARKFWSFQPIANPASPAPKDVAWAGNDVDRFVLARLEQSALRPAAPAGKAELVRRVYFDLTGLPPTPEEVAAFVNDPSEGAY